MKNLLRLLWLAVETFENTYSSRINWEEIEMFASKFSETFSSFFRGSGAVGFRCLTRFLTKSADSL